MEFICLGSGSSGNAYILKHNNRCVLIECGFKFNDIIEKLVKYGIAITDIQGVICTHLHKDHSLSAKDFKEFGFNVYQPYENDLPISIQIDFLNIYCFPVMHDAASCGFVFVNNITKETMLFINDTAFFELEERLTKLKYDYIAIECNHVYSKLVQLLENAKADKKFKYERQSKFHLSLINTKKILESLALKDTKAIYLMHLSQEASDPEIMKKTIQNTFNKSTYVCLKDGGLL